MELYDKRPVACRIAPIADRKDNTQYSIYNKVDTSDHASDQTEYTWIYHKRPVACRITHFADKRTMNNIAHTIYSKAYTSDQLENQQSTINQIKQHGRFSTAHTERTKS